jgi:pimeloyl-[acyl-carrier protein] synthase
MTFLDLTDPEFVQNPYPVYDQLRSEDPVHRSEKGFWFLTRYADVSAALRNPSLSNRPSRFSVVHESNRTRHVCADVAANLVAFQDAPQHLAPRRILATTFLAFVKERETMVQDIAKSMVAGLLGKSEIEFFREFAEPYAATCIARVMGLPSADMPKLTAWSNLLFYIFNHIPSEMITRVNEGLAEFRAYVARTMESRKQAPQSDLLTILLAARASESDVSDEEIIDNAMLLIADGIENVQAGLTGAVATILQHHQAIDAIRSGESSMQGLIDECLRYESPGQYQGRIARETINIGGKTIRADSVVLLGLGAANRDPSVFDRPDRFIVDRQARHLAFGLGHHGCIGSAFVRREFEAALVALFDGPFELSLCDDAMTWSARAGHRWPASLRLRISRRAGG